MFVVQIPDLIPVISARSPIGNEEPISSYELHIAVKDYCFGRDDRLIGVSVMQLKDIQDQVHMFRNRKLFRMHQLSTIAPQRVPAPAGWLWAGAST